MDDGIGPDTSDASPVITWLIAAHKALVVVALVVGTWLYFSR